MLLLSLIVQYLPEKYEAKFSPAEIFGKCDIKNLGKVHERLKIIFQFQTVSGLISQKQRKDTNSVFTEPLWKVQTNQSRLSEAAFERTPRHSY